MKAITIIITAIEIAMNGVSDATMTGAIETGIVIEIAGTGDRIAMRAHGVIMLIVTIRDIIHITVITPIFEIECEAASKLLVRSPLA